MKPFGVSGLDPGVQALEFQARFRVVGCHGAWAGKTKCTKGARNYTRLSVLRRRLIQGTASRTNSLQETHCFRVSVWGLEYRGTVVGLRQRLRI